MAFVSIELYEFFQDGILVTPSKGKCLTILLKGKEALLVCTHAAGFCPILTAQIYGQPTEQSTMLSSGVTVTLLHVGSVVLKQT